MRKTSLHIHRTSIRPLSTSGLRAVRGGAESDTCPGDALSDPIIPPSNVHTGCPSHSIESGADWCIPLG
jgi:hypothetical protein